MSFVMDCSVAIARVLPDENSTYADKIFQLLEQDQCFVPAIWPLEIGNALLVAQRKRRIVQREAAMLVELFQQLPITISDENSLANLAAIMSVADKYNLSTYDAAYLELAMRKSLRLATLDDELSKAAKRARLPLL